MSQGWVAAPLAATLHWGVRSLATYPLMAAMLNTRDALFTQLFAETRAALRRYVRRFVGSRETADEIVQEAFLRTYEQGDAVETPKPFLFSTARNLAANEYRHRRIAQTDLVGDIDDSGVVQHCESPEAQALGDERSRLIREAIERLPARCRASFALRIFHGCSYKEIADQLDLSVKTVEKHISRGLRESHQFLKRRYQESTQDHG